MLDLQVIRVGETKKVGEYPVKFSGYRYYTGLQIKKDSGLPVVYSGFLVMLAGFLLRYVKNGGASRPEEVA